MLRQLVRLGIGMVVISRFIYSPLGYRIIRSLRPIVVRVKRENEMPVFNRSYLENLCNDVSLVNMDEDDKAAIILTMKTVWLKLSRT